MHLDPDSCSQLMILLVLILLSALLTAAEFSLSAISRSRVRLMAAEHHPKAMLIDKLLRDSAQVFETILIGNNLFNILAVALGTLMALELWGPKWGFFYAVLGLVFVIIIFGEIIPKALAAKSPERVSLLVIRPLYVLIILLFPLVKVFNALTQLFFHMAGVKAPSLDNHVTEQEIINMVAAGQEEGTIHLEEKTMIRGIFEFTDTVVRDVMVPRPDIVAVEVNSSYQDVMDNIQREQFSRMPVYQEAIDDILGVVHIKDLIMAGACHQADFSLTDYLRQPFFVPETKKVNELFKAMKKDKVHMAIVLDEYGSTAGLVTMEDLIEEILGEIQDEHDMEEPDCKRLGADTFEVNAALRIEELNEKLGLQLVCDEAETIGGIVFTELGRVPRIGDKVRLDGVELTVKAMEGHRLEKLILVKIKD